MNIQKTQQGFGVVKVLVSIPLLLIGLVVLAVVYTELNKAYWDYRVREFCENDGGATIFERVEILKSDYPNIQLTADGQIIIPPERQLASDDPFSRSYRTHYIRQGFVSVTRHEQSIIRTEDGKILSTHISYGRGGGDFPTGFHPSHFLCGSDEEELRLLNFVITVKGG